MKACSKVFSTAMKRDTTTLLLLEGQYLVMTRAVGSPLGDLLSLSAQWNRISAIMHRLSLKLETT